MAGTLHPRAVDRFPLQPGTHLPGRAHVVTFFGKDPRDPDGAPARAATGAGSCDPDPRGVLPAGETRRLSELPRSVDLLLTPVLRRIQDGGDAHG